MRSLRRFLIDDIASIRTALARDGVVVVQGAVPVRALRELRRELEQAFVDVSLARRTRAGVKPILEAFAGPDARRRGAAAMRRAHLIPQFHRIPQSRSVRDFWDALFGEEVFTHPKAALRIALPVSGEVTPVHQDFSYQPSSKRCTAMWVPLHDVDAGVLEFALGSHRRGPLEPARLESVSKRSSWSSAPLRAGDAFLFGALTLHRAPPNTTPRFRCSIDFRAQPMSEPVLEALLAGDLVLPFALTWPEVYARLPADFDRKYFWSDRHPAVAIDPASRAASAKAIEHSRLDRFRLGDLAQLEHVRRIRRASIDVDRRAEAKTLLARHSAEAKRATAG